MLLLFARCAAPAALIWFAACTRAGELVVLLDSGDAAGNMEVVAVRFDPSRLGSTSRSGPATSDSLALLRARDDSAAALAARFSATRDSLNAIVQALDTVDRRTRSYALRYAEIHRRTLAAEHLRGARDNVRARADSLRSRLAPRSRTGRGSATVDRVAGDDDVIAASGGQDQRHAVHGAALTLHLAPGEWWIGVAPAGSEPPRYQSAIIRGGVSDTLRLAARRPGVGRATP